MLSFCWQNAWIELEVHRRRRPKEVDPEWKRECLGKLAPTPAALTLKMTTFLKTRTAIRASSPA